MCDDPNDRGLSRKHLMAAIDNSLRRLGTDYIDLYQIHRWDPETPIEETLTALHDIVRSGKARYIGASSMMSPGSSPRRFTSPTGTGWTRFVSMQNHYNLVYREEEREMLPLCREEGDRRDSVEPARARLSRRQPPGRRATRTTARAQDRRHRARRCTTRTPGFHASPIASSPWSQASAA